MNDQSETERSSTISHWFGLDRLRLTDGDQAIDVTVGPGSHWDRSHLRRLRQSGDLPGMVPIIDSDFSADGKPFAVTPVVDAPTLADLLQQGNLSWTDGAGIAEAAARAIHEAHLRGLFHGALSPADIHVIGDDVALAGVGLGLGGQVPADRAPWAAPEVRDGADPTERSDVYSLGKVLEASLGDAIDTAPRSIRRLIMWSSSDTPEARPPSAMEFASILAEGLGEDRRTFGPAFISTAGLTDLAGRASSAVSGHTPSDTARATASSAGGAIAAGAAGAAVGAGAGMLAGREADQVADEGFSVTPTTVEAAPVAEPATPAATTPVAATPVASRPVDDRLVSASAGDAGGPRTEAINEYTVPAAAQTIDLDEIYLPKKQRSRAGLMVSGILLLGLAGIAYGIFSSSSNTGSETPATPPGQTSVTTNTTTAASEATTSTAAAEVTTVTSAAPASTTVTTAAPTTVTTAATTVTTAAPTTVTTAAPTTVTTAAPTTAAPPTVAPTTVTPAPPTVASSASVTAGAATPTSLVNTGGPIPSKDAAVQILHGVPKTPVDLYVNGKALATNFTTGSIAGPVKLAPGNYQVALYAAIPNAPKDTSARTDAALLDKSVTVGTDPATVVAYLGQDGKPAVSAYTERFSTLPAGRSRVLVRHLMSFGPAEVFVNGKSIGTVKPGDETSADVAAGSALVELKGPDGQSVYKATVKVPAGELASFTAIGSPADKSAELMLQRFTGLQQAAPAAVPTGDSGLLGLGEDQTGLRLVYGVMTLLALSGGFVLFRRQRSLSR